MATMSPRPSTHPSSPALLLFCSLTTERSGFLYSQESTNASFCSSDLTETRSLSNSLKWQKQQQQ